MGDGLTSERKNPEASRLRLRPSDVRGLLPIGPAPAGLIPEHARHVNQRQ